MQLDVFRRLDDLDRRVRQLERVEPSEGSLVSGEWRYSTGTTLPPGSGQFRTNTDPITAFHIHILDEAGYNRSVGIGQIALDDTLSLRFANGNTAVLTATGDAVNNGTYWTVPVTVTSGTPIPNKGQLTTVIASIES